MDNLIKYSLDVSRSDLDLALNIVTLISDNGFSVEDYSDILELLPNGIAPELIDQELLEKSTCNPIIHIFFNTNESHDQAISRLADLLDDSGISYILTSTNVNNLDWQENWKKYYKPCWITDKILICPTWEEIPQHKLGDVVVKLDPGMAFGTGTHETTRLCINLLQKHISKETLSFLDIGCGSGILSIIASKLGASSVYGIDIDEIAVRTSKKNAELNDTLNTNFIKADLTSSNLNIKNKYSVICANIVADIIIDNLHEIKNFISYNGIFICSGIINCRREDVVNSLIKNKFEIRYDLNDNGWVALSAVSK